MTTTISKNANTLPKTKKQITPLFAKDYNVYINHTDAGGIVYHANHLVFFENCRRDWFGQLGLNGYFLQTDEGQVQHFVVSQADLQYKRAILLDEVISVRVDKIELKPASIVFYQSIHRHSPDKASTDNNLTDNASTDSVKNSAKNNANANNSLLSSGKIVIACVQNQVRAEPDVAVASAAPMRPIRVPNKLREALQEAIDQPINTQ
ncbi:MULTISPECIES: hotdog domain-containing protein [Psychrobacter]|jgi:acyl-CoA thioester hydrolase|uniref:hotdog domain-containing protein n=2 Tax=Psychrobacter TaxID=497 RepID=UPI001917FCBB|nr:MULTISPECIES: thioesterase family protein [Psychrobacter]